MAIKFQYNKTSLNNLGKQVRKAKSYSDKLIRELDASLKRYDYLASLWNEFEPNLISITDVDLETVKVAGVRTPQLKDIRYEIHEFNAFSKPAWYADGVAILKELSRLGIESEVYMEKSRILDFQRKKATQKVNLYEKVQIPGYQEAIRKIKRYMEDEENLTKAASKIVKNRHQTEEEEEMSNGN